MAHTNANMEKVLDVLRDRMYRGEISSLNANVEMVRAERVRIIAGPVPAAVRSALNTAVKNGELGHFKKDGLKPEVYFHPTFEYLAVGTRKSEEEKAHRAIARVSGWPEATTATEA